MTVAIPEHTYRYLGASSISQVADRVDLNLATSGGVDPNPQLASGFVLQPHAAARALLIVGSVAATRFWMPPNMVAAAILAADPVVTTSTDGIRFESFSLCGGVYARFDLDAAAFDGDIYRRGTTNVDMGQELRSALTQIGGRDPLRIVVGPQALEVTTLTGNVVERKVPLPKRWVQGFAEVSLATSGLEPCFTLSGGGLQKFFHSLPSASARAASWVVPSGSSARLTSRRVSQAVPARGIERLRPLRDAVAMIQSLTAFGPIQQSENTSDGYSAWVADMGIGRLSIALSPAPSKGFSGEGQWLRTIAENQPQVEVDRAEQAIAGTLGYDVATARWFPRDLPFDRSHLATSRRLLDAQKLVADGCLTADSRSNSVTVSSGKAEYIVTKQGESLKCTCPWWGKHQESRGPCKHVLATIILDASR